MSISRGMNEHAKFVAYSIHGQILCETQAYVSKRGAFTNVRKEAQFKNDACLLVFLCYICIHFSFT